MTWDGEGLIKPAKNMRDALTFVCAALPLYNPKAPLAMVLKQGGSPNKDLPASCPLTYPLQSLGRVAAEKGDNTDIFHPLSTPASWAALAPIPSVSAPMNTRANAPPLCASVEN